MHGGYPDTDILAILTLLCTITVSHCYDYNDVLDTHMYWLQHFACALTLRESIDTPKGGKKATWDLVCT
eukprot:scaffold2552_cov152-Skeletonema_menzelii.AAC.1